MCSRLGMRKVRPTKVPCRSQQLGQVGGHQKRRNILERGGGICKVIEVRNITELSKKKKKRRVVAAIGGVVFGRVKGKADTQK